MSKLFCCKNGQYVIILRSKIISESHCPILPRVPSYPGVPYVSLPQVPHAYNRPTPATLEDSVLIV